MKRMNRPKTLEEFLIYKSSIGDNIDREYILILLKSWDKYQEDISNGCFLSWDKFEDYLENKNKNGNITNEPFKPIG